MSKQVAILMGSDSDLPVMKKCCAVLDEFGVAYHVRVLSAHRTPLQTHAFVQQADKDGVQVFIAGAGGAAHLAGTIAANTIKPVLGVPLKMDESLGGIDAMLSTLQMPGGIPVGTLSIGSAGAKNAGLLAIAILALKDEKIATALRKYRSDMLDQVLAKDKKVQEEMGK